MRDWLKYAVVLLALALIVTLSFGAGFLTHAVINQTGNGPALAGLGVDLGRLTGKSEPDKFKVFWETWGIVKREFYGQVPDDQGMTHGAIRGALSALNDPNTVFLEPRAASMERSDLAGQFDGIGATVQTDAQGQLVIVSPMPGSPAEKAGLKANDIIVRVGATEITGMGQTEAITLIRGPKGTPVTLTILRNGNTFDVTIIRAPIETPTVVSRLLEEPNTPVVGYIRLTLFGERSNGELERAIKDMRDKGAKALIIDVRNNPGGFLTSAIEITSQFIGEGVIAYERRSDGKEEVFRAKNGGVATDIPVVLLINGGSASASEILAGAIRDRKRGILIGEKTFGKGSVQNVHQLSDGSTLHVTVAHWLTPDKNDISKAGIEPHIVSEPGAEGTQRGRDLQLDRALEYLRTGS